MSIDRIGLVKVFGVISSTMHENREYLISLDQKNGDGDLGISMDEGYRAVSDYVNTTAEVDLGKLFMGIASVFNESAPSSLGTITSFGFLGMAKVLKGKEEISLDDLASAIRAGITRIMEKAQSKPGEKTILDSLYPAMEALEAHSKEPVLKAFEYARDAARSGAENTRLMRSVHGRAAYYGDKSIGLIDGGAEVGRLIFESIFNHLEQERI